MKKKHPLFRSALANTRGTLMMVLLVALAVGGLLASRLVPDTAVQAQRRNEQILKAELSGIRSAMDLERFCAEGSASACLNEYNALVANPGSHTLVVNYLEALSSKGRFLRDGELANSMVEPHRWASSTTDFFYWQARVNLLQVDANMAASSFETGYPKNQNESSIATMTWKDFLDTNLATASLATDDYPGIMDGRFDDYENQNKMGRLMQGTGQSLRLRKL